MNYELAKQLKEAGFPFDLMDTTHKMIEKQENNIIDRVMVPTLSELLESCDERFAALYRLVDGWAAEAYIVGYQRFEGSTPEEAVAKLWLALNKK